jgi:thiamine-phosphate pyrophosphorylase
MDRKLLAYAFRVKPWRRDRLPTLWLFSDATRLPDPRAAILHLPRGRAGVVLRGAAPDLASAVAGLCRARRIALAIAGDWRLAAHLRAGLHLPARAPARRRGSKPCFLTAAAHSARELRRARRVGARLAFLSPVFRTASHPGAPALGVVRWVALASRAGLAVAALGGIDGARARRLPRRYCAGLAAITALGDAAPNR